MRMIKANLSPILLLHSVHSTERRTEELEHMRTYWRRLEVCLAELVGSYPGNIRIPRSLRKQR